MGELILCHRSIAAVPYYIEEISLNVYSLEELSYYIVHNVYLLNDEFMCTDLCNWIGRELGSKHLQEQLLNLLTETTPLHIFVGHILQASGYLTSKEIKDTLELIASFENKSDLECRKMRADRLMDKGKLSDAIYEYENLIDISKDTESQEFQGNVWHNLGTAYGRLFFFEEAAMCFEQAYIRNRRRQSLIAMLHALRCGRLETEFAQAIAKYQVTEEERDRIIQEVSRVSQSDKIIEFKDHLEEMRISTPDSDQYLERLRQQLDVWKSEYIELCGI